jgi:uncharacterized Zn finger protein
MKPQSTQFPVDSAILSLSRMRSIETYLESDLRDILIMLTLNLTETILRRHATAQSFDRGAAYYKSGAVASPTLRGQVLQADVEGSDVQPYRVTVEFDQGGVTIAHCTCEYSYEGWCKHIVAMLLVCLRQPDRVEQRPTLAQLLDRLNPLQTQQLVQTLVNAHPELIDDIDRYLITPAPKNTSPAAKAVRQTEIDPVPFRRRVRQIIRDGLRYLEDGFEEDPITENIEVVIQDAEAFSEAGDGNSAVVILEAITQACAEDWDDLADYGADSDAIVAALNEAWTDAILSAELTPKQVVDLQVELEAWQDQLGGDFEMSLEALRQGWDYLPLKQVLGGEISELGSWDGEAPYYSDDLALIRLRILDRQARYDEYLYLAEAEGQTQYYLTMLAQLGRTAEAVSAAHTDMSVMEEAFALAKTLREQNAVPEALEIAQAGLSLPGHCGYALATWTSDLAEGLGQTDVALRASTIAFKTRPNFADYRRVEALAGAAWTTQKAELLGQLRSNQSWEFTQAKVDIFLHEGLIEDAIAVVSDQSSYQSALIHRVMDAAIASHSTWVIENACRRAESIMDAKKAEHYGHAIEWLRKARTAYLHLEKRAEWVAYRSQLMQTHARKYKLIGLLKPQDLG